MASTSSVSRARSRYRGFESIPVRVVVRVGCALLSLARLSELEEGQILHLDRVVGSPFDLLAEGRVLGAVEPVASEARIALKLVAAAEPDP